MNSMYRSRQIQSRFFINRWILPCLFMLVFGGSCTRSYPSFDSMRSTAIQSAREALDLVHSLEYDHIVSSSFIPETIDLDGNGRSLFETRIITVSDDAPFRGMKTIEIVVSWPKSGVLLSAGLDQVCPELDSVRISLMIDQRYFS